MQESTINMMQTEWLPTIMQGSFNEIYVMDCESLRFLQVNQAACDNLQYTADKLACMSLTDISSKPLTQKLLPLLNAETAQLNFETTLVRKDGSHYPIEFRVFLCGEKISSVLIAIGKDVSSQHETAQALGRSKSLFSAIVSNTPGLVYQFTLQADGSVAFPYLSEGCQALLGLSAEQLSAEPALFFDLILPEDRQSYMESMLASSAEQKSWNWDGRIWIEAWKDIKWINLRATPQLLPDGRVQWDGIMTNITQSKLEEFELKHSRTRLSELSAHIEQVKELERTRIAREVHDDLGGNLTAIKMALTLLTTRLPAGNKALAEKAAYVDLLVDRTIESAHRIASDLRPGILDFGIVAALEWQTEEFEKQIGIPCVFSSNTKEIELHPDQATAIFRIFQEALTNIAKHANATKVNVQLALTRSSIHLKIIDNGKGISAAERLKPQSFGLRGMMERASFMGGKLSISPTPGGGNTITIKLPHSTHTPSLQLQ